MLASEAFCAAELNRIQTVSLGIVSKQLSMDPIPAPLLGRRLRMSVSPFPLVTWRLGPLNEEPAGKETVLGPAAGMAIVVSRWVTGLR